MQINSNINNQSFTAFKLCSKAENNLRKVLKPKDWNEFDAIINSQASNKTVDIYLFGRDGDRFYASLRLNKNIKAKTVYQWPFFEPALKFFNRIAKQADKMKNDAESMPKINIDEIISKLK